MAQNGRITRGSIPRALQYGLDEIIDQNGKEYKGKGDMIFQEIKTEKAYWEMMQLAGMGIAAPKNEGDAITFDSIDQHFVYRVPVQTVSKSARITREMIKDNLYEDLLPRIGREQLKALAHSRDIYQAAILNNFTSSTAPYAYGDGSALCDTAHKLQTGGTSANLLTVSENLCEDSIEQLKILVDNFKNDDGLVSQYEVRDLVVPVGLQFEATRIVKNPMRPATADRDISAIYSDGVIKGVVMWKRLTSTTAHYVTTDADYGLVMVRREGIYTEVDQEPYTHDTILTAAERYWPSVGDWRGVAATGN